MSIAAAACLWAAQLAWSQAAGTVHGTPKDRARVVISRLLPKLDGDHLRAVLVNVQYGPGEASPPHSHPCAVLAYVTAGSVRTQVENQPEAIYKVGESFYEEPNAVHLVSANASSTKPASFLAYMICDHEGPLSVSTTEGIAQKGGSR